ncbi:hypothetical protein [Pseudomonas cremoricolorata]|uniref:hypothetical protein n=1 Tax=Pseudomonas cremoricolorata TaxID=157783 RepID=UPI0004153BEA|nr:hypothetical protein [Pseudomonas cremoricolorata]
MVTHYSPNGLEAVCGRRAQTLVSTAVSDEVSCKSCQRSLLKPAVTQVAKAPSLAELRQQARAAKAVTAPFAAERAAAPATHTPRAAAAHGSASVAAGFSVKAAWAAQLAEQGGGNRAPRGTRRNGRR